MIYHATSVLQCILFADDTKVYRTIKDAHDFEALQSDLDKLDQYSMKWLLKFHPDKCKVLTVENPTELSNESLHLYNNDEKHSQITLSTYLRR